MLAVYKGCACGETLDLKVESSAFGSATGVNRQLELASVELDRWNENHKNCKERVSVQLPEPEGARPNDQADTRRPAATEDEVPDAGDKPRGASVGEAAHSGQEALIACPSTYAPAPGEPVVRCQLVEHHLGPHKDRLERYTWRQ